MSARRWWLAALAMVLLVVVGAALLGSTAPDGLQQVATDAGFADQASDQAVGLLPGYGLPGFVSEELSTTLAGILGAGVLFVAMVLLGRVLSRRQRRHRRPSG